MGCDKAARHAHCYSGSRAVPYWPVCRRGKMKYQVTSPAMMLKASIASSICIQKRNQLMPRLGSLAGEGASSGVCVVVFMKRKVQVEGSDTPAAQRNYRPLHGATSAVRGGRRLIYVKAMWFGRLRRQF